MGDIITAFLTSYPDLAKLKRVLASSLTLICMMAGRSDDNYYRLDEERVMSWLACKVQIIMRHLASKGGAAFATMGEEGLRSYAVELTGEWLAPSWMAKLRDQMQTSTEEPAAESSSPALQESKSNSQEDYRLGKRVAPSTPSPASGKNSKVQATKMAKMAKHAEGSGKMSMFFTKKT